MNKDNPACLECPKGRNGIHYWKKIPVGERYPNGRVTLTSEWRLCCDYCRTVLSLEDSADCARE